MAKKTKHFIREIFQQKGGQRYQFIFNHFHHRMHKKHILKLILVLLGIILILVGVVLIFTPGPGGLFLILGLALLASVSLCVARFMDKLEAFFIKIFKKRKQKRGR